MNSNLINDIITCEKEKCARGSDAWNEYNDLLKAIEREQNVEVIFAASAIMRRLNDHKLIIAQAMRTLIKKYAKQI